MPLYHPLPLLPLTPPNPPPPPNLSPLTPLTPLSEPVDSYGVSSIPGDGISRAFLNRVLSVWMPPSLSKPATPAVSPEMLGLDPRYTNTGLN